MKQLLIAADLCFSYGDRPALRDVSLSLESGEIVAIIGPNGSGKSTLIKTLLGHLPAGGRILWQEKVLGDWRLRDLARIVAYLPQSPRHEAGQTVAEVLRLGRAARWGAFGLESSADEKITLEVARTLALEDVLDRPMDQMSGGQRQRVFIGRCLTQQPAALLLDEPNTFLDLRHQIDLWQILRKLARESSLGVLVASHELNIAGAFADRMILLHEGRVAAAGPPDQVLRAEVLSPVYGLPLVRYGDAPHAIVMPQL
jgi:ABC-type cobalamin/Fe3+-siderophores transport system ATPase subunit